MHKPPLAQLPPVLRHTLKSDRGSPHNNETNCVWGPQPGRSYLLFEQALLIFQACLQSPEDLLVIFQGDPPTPACAERTRELTPMSGRRAPMWRGCRHRSTPRTAAISCNKNGRSSLRVPAYVLGMNQIVTHMLGRQARLLKEWGQEMVSASRGLAVGGLH